MKTLQELRDQISKEKKYVGIKPYSHNIVTLCLQQIDREFGTKEANKTIKYFGLIRLGWNLKKEEEDGENKNLSKIKRETNNRY